MSLATSPMAINIANTGLVVISIVVKKAINTVIAIVIALVVYADITISDFEYSLVVNVEMDLKKII